MYNKLSDDAIKCKGSDKIGLHFLIQTSKNSNNLMCAESNYEYAYYNMESNEWVKVKNDPL